YRRSVQYKCGEITKVTKQLGFNFEFDRRYDDGWTNENYNNSEHWDNAVCFELSDALLIKRPVEKLLIKQRVPSKSIAWGTIIRENIKRSSVAEYMQTDYLSSKTHNEMFDESQYIQPNDNGVYLVFDLLREECGFLEIEIEAENGTVLDIAYGEHLDNLRVNSKIASRNFANRYIAKGGKQTFTHYFSRIAGRYIQINMFNVKVKTKIIYAGIVPTEYPVTERGNIIFDNWLHTEIYKTSVRTLRLCMHEHYEDCPWREQALYAMDSRSQALFGYYCFGEYKFVKSSLILLGDTLRADGFFNLTAPSNSKITIPVFSMIWIVEVYEYILYSGDLEGGKDFLPIIENMLKKYLDMENGLAKMPFGKEYWHFYDWSAGMYGPIMEEIDKNRIDAPYNLFLCMALKSAIKIYEFYGQEKVEYKESLEVLIQAIKKEFWDNKKLLFYTYKSNGE
ncbi:MAG: hypothetical protein EOM23_08030, partial [Candidatus Moranbacteria bacterium]|nr:hypothetical protein [Candidatus Moranbacteria bacterium]